MKSALRSVSYARIKEFVRRSKCVPFRRFLGDVRREFMQRLSVAFHSNKLGSYLRRVLQKGNAYEVTCLLAPRTSYRRLVGFSL
jgi:hypothetical protein